MPSPLIIVRIETAPGPNRRVHPPASPPIVHRDLKPANILIQRDAQSRLVLKVADYGIGGIATARAIQATQSAASHYLLQTTSVRGTYSALYASPEQMRGLGPDPRDDVHALGVIWYQLVTRDLTAGRPGGGKWKRRLVENHGLTDTDG